MFDVITGDARHIPRHAVVPLLVSTAVQTVVVGAVLVVPLLVVTDAMPQVPVMMAFVAAPPIPPPPPPPPPAPTTRSPVPEPSRATNHTNPAAAPVEAPSRIEPEPVATMGVRVEGGVEGGVPGGIPGGVLGGIPEKPLPPAPPPPRPAPHAPLRIGGDVKAPALLHRVEPVYPELAARAKVEGIVILEAQVSTAGQVVDVRVLKSAGLLDQFAIDAVRQWRYSPILLNGHPAPFVLTVTISFSLKRPGGSSSGVR